MRYVVTKTRHSINSVGQVIRILEMCAVRELAT